MSKTAGDLLEETLKRIVEDRTIEEERVRQIIQEEFKQHLTVGTVNVKQAASYIGVSDKTLYNMCQLGEIDHLRVRGAIRFKYSQLDAYLDKQTVKARREA